MNMTRPYTVDLKMRIMYRDLDRTSERDSMGYLCADGRILRYIL
jgi:hypothetical protein